MVRVWVMVSDGVRVRVRVRVSVRVRVRARVRVRFTRQEPVGPLCKLMAPDGAPKPTP